MSRPTWYRCVTAAQCKKNKEATPESHCQTLFIFHSGNVLSKADEYHWRNPFSYGVNLRLHNFEVQTRNGWLFCNTLKIERFPTNDWCTLRELDLLISRSNNRNRYLPISSKKRSSKSTIRKVSLLRSYQFPRILRLAWFRRKQEVKRDQTHPKSENQPRRGETIGALVSVWIIHSTNVLICLVVWLIE